MEILWKSTQTITKRQLFYETSLSYVQMSVCLSVCLNDLVVCLGLCLSVNRFKPILYVRVCICYCVFDWISEFLTNGFFQVKLYKFYSQKIISREWNTTVVCFQHSYFS